MAIVYPKNVIEGTSLNIKSLLNPTNIIPEYQRDYVWEEDNVKVLWQDLIEHFESHTDEKDYSISPDIDGYFLGAMVVINGDHNPEEKEIVDGQQRLTTLTIISSVLYHRLLNEKKPDNRIEAWKRELSNMLYSFDGNMTPKLKFSNKSIEDFFFRSTFPTAIKRDDYWEQHEIKQKLSNKKSPFYKIKNSILTSEIMLEEFLKKNNKSQQREKLISFIQIFIEGVILLRIEAKSYSNAYSLFESLNNRGVKLNDADLIKNLILKKLEKEDISIGAKNWNAFSENIEKIKKSIKTVDFVHYSYLSRHGNIKIKKIFDAIKPLANNSKQARSLSEELKEDSNIIIKITQEIDPSWNKDTITLIQDLIGINIKHCYPFVICAYREYKSDITKFNDHLITIINFSFRYMKIMKLPLDGFTKKIVEACEMVRNNDDISKIREKLRNEVPDEMFIHKFQDFSISNAKMAFYIVSNIEKTLLNGTTPNHQSIKQNLEHVMPKKPSADFWPEASRNKEANPKIYNEYIWRIGNLIPLPGNINMSIKNNSIDQKIKNDKGVDYTSGGHSLVSPGQIKNYLVDGQWTYKSIENRQKDLAKHAVKAWSL